MFFSSVAGESPQFGRGSFPVDGKILKCKNFTFPSPFTNDNVHVHITIQNESPKSNVYEAAVGWVEDVGVAGFTGCVVASGPDLSSRQLSADWMAFQDTPPGSQTGRLQVPLFTTGSKCVETSFGMVINYFLLLEWFYLFLLQERSKTKLKQNYKFCFQKHTIGFICIRISFTDSKVRTTCTLCSTINSTTVK